MTSSEKVRAVVEKLAVLNPFTDAKDLPDIPRPEEPFIPRELPALQQLPYVQKVLNMLSYNFLPQTFFYLKKHRSLESILLTSKEILSEALPIRCLEATFVGLYLTQGLTGVDRIPLSFKSRVKGRLCHHIVLVIRCKSLYGALGLSRKSTLMDKPMIYQSLFDLIIEYKEQYEAVGHELVDFKLGLCVSHELHSRKAPCWRYIVVSMVGTSLPLRLETTNTGRDELSSEESGQSLGVICQEELKKLADVAQVLTHYTELLNSISLHYERHAAPHSLGLSNKSLPTCLQDLHEMAGAAARQENQRRLEEVRKGRSPCVIYDTSTKKRAASRSVSKIRVVSSRTSPVTARASVTPRTQFFSPKTHKEECPLDRQNHHRRLKQQQPQEEPHINNNHYHQEQQQRDESAKRDKTQQQEQQKEGQLPLVTGNNSPHVVPLTLCGTADSNGRAALGSSHSNLPSCMTSLRPFLDTKAADITPLLGSSSGELWEFSILPHEGLDEVSLHNLL